MSADNYIGIIPTKDGRYGVIPYGNMSMLDEDCLYRGRVESYYNDRASALVAAHDLNKQSDIVEYGVIELEPITDKLCGTCFVCVHERKVISDDIPRCTACKQPLSDSEWVTQTSKGIFHNRCERELR